MGYLIYSLVLSATNLVTLSICYRIRKIHGLYIPLLVMNAICFISACVAWWVLF